MIKAVADGSEVAEREQHIDVCALEAPEPLLAGIAAATALQPGHYLRMVHRMRPCLLYGQLEPQGFVTDTRTGAQGLCEVFIWRAGDDEAATAAQVAAQPLEPWSDR